MKDISELLAPLVGRWATTITMLHPSEERGAIHRAVDSYRWLAGNKVLIHEVEAFMGKPMVSFEVYTQEADGRITARNFAGDGQVTDYQATMANNEWRVVGPTEQFASTAMGDNRIEGLWKLKTAAGWVDWMTVRLDRVS